MPFFVQGFFDDHMLTAATDTPKKAFADAIEWHVVRGFSDVTISDGMRSYSIAEFSEVMALREIAETNLKEPELQEVLQAIGQGTFKMKHRTVDYDVREDQPGLWRWIILPATGLVLGPAIYRSREKAVEACHLEINDGIERTRIQALRAAQSRP